MARSAITAIAVASGIRAGERSVATAAMPSPTAGAASAPTGIRLRWTQYPQPRLDQV